MIKRLVIIAMLILVLLVPQTVCAFGSRTHIEIVDRMDGREDVDYDYQMGCVLPDLALALVYVGYPNPNLNQAIFQSPEFVDALWEVDGGSFTRGWVSHVSSDTIEVPYSQAKVAAGAPEGADWAVDYFYPTDWDIWIEPSHEAAVQAALDISYPGVVISDDDWWHIMVAYNGYLSNYDLLFPDEQGIAEEWYSDNDYYLWRSVYRSHIDLLRGHAEMSDALWFVNQWLYGHAEQTEVLEVVNLWLYPRGG